MRLFTHCFGGTNKHVTGSKWMAKRKSPEFYSNGVMLGFGFISIVIALIAVAVRF
jgi:hypothetical protein